MLPSKKFHHNFVSSQAMSQRPCKGLAISSPNPKLDQIASEIPDVKFFPPTPASCMHPQKYLLVFIRTRKSQSNQPVHLKSASSNRKKSKRRPFPSHFVHASFLHDEKPARIQVMKALYKNPEEIEMSGDK
jgi:hypothetical protein